MSSTLPAGTSEPELDIVTIGRTSVDLYGRQIGSRLEDVSSFAKSVGGCPANIAIGAARLGLRAGIVTRVGGEQLGRFVREQFEREGVDTRGVITDPKRLTALAILAVENETTFPLLFYRENCADMALEEWEIDPAFIASSAAVLVTGTHFSQPNTDAAQRGAIRMAREAGRKVAFDIDYRPNLWGLGGHDTGEQRFVASERVTERLRSVLPECDLVVGTEEEILIAGGGSDVLAALTAIRERSPATIVLKRGPMGCVVFDGPIPNAIEDGIVGKGIPVEVYNVLGAGDAFMAGFLRGWLRGEPLGTAATWANACGAFAVSRLLCSPEYPTFDELSYFLAHGSPHRALRKDETLNHIHWATTRRAHPDHLTALAIDHRAQLEAVADRVGAPREKINRFKLLALDAAARVAGGRKGFGVLIDETYGREALFAAAKLPFWIGRPVELPGSRPLRFEFTEAIGSRLIEWPVTHTAKCLCFFHPEDPPALRDEQTRTLRTLYDAVRRTGLELLIEIISSRQGPLRDRTTADVLAALYAAGIKPDWWKLEPQPSPGGWAEVGSVIAANDPWCRGVVLLGLEAPEEELERAFADCASAPIVKGFAVGRTIFNEAAEKWLAGQIDDDEAVGDMAARFARLTDAWNKARTSRAA
jgi:5-dehydro-2-deoxygluconokinase